MIAPVVASDPDFRVAVAELPRSARLADDPAGAVVVVAGSAADVRAAVTAGAGVLLAVRPDAALPEVDVPVILHRPLLRPDLAIEAAPADARPALVHVEASAADADLAATLRDALGWARVLAGGELRIDARQAAPDGVAALLEATTADGARVPVAVVVTRRGGTAPWIRATAVGAERCEVTLDVARGLARVERATEAGRSRTATRWESAERLALRRAVEALRGSGVDDRADWERDDALATALAHPGSAAPAGPAAE